MDQSPLLEVLAKLGRFNYILWGKPVKIWRRMGMRCKMRLDLHTHCQEATRYARLDKTIVEQIVITIKEKGLDGIAITDHNNKDYAFQVRDLVRRHFNEEVLIIPGQELDTVYQHIIELYLPGERVFRFIAHPGTPSSYWINYLDPEQIQGIEINNGNYPIDQEQVKDWASKKGLLLLSNSDAHSLSNIGKFYNEIELEVIYAHSKPL